jgi:tetratricopeptide (TPR) repeat protein
LFETEQNARAVGRTLASLGRLFLDRGRFADAVGALQSAVTRLPGDVGLHMDFARALCKSGQPHAALGVYGSVLTAAPENVEALVGRGAINAEYGEPAAALDDLDNAIRQQPALAGRCDVTAARAQAFARLTHGS